MASALLSVPAARADDPLRPALGGHVTVAAQMRAEARDNRRDDLARRARSPLARRVADDNGERFDAARRAPPPARHERPTSCARRMDELRESRFTASPTLQAIAACESGGNPATDTGNGFYGKYQFTLATWRRSAARGNPAARLRGRAGPPRDDALRARGRVALAGLRPLASAARMDAAALRAEFPVLERLAFLNAGTDGPVPAAAVRRRAEALESELTRRPLQPALRARFALQAELRELYARVLGCAVEDVALQTSTSEGLGTVLAGLDLGPGDEIVTSDSEHPGPDRAAARGPRAGRDDQAPCRCATSPTPSAASTTLVACSHVSWVTGEFAPAALAELDVPVVLDGAQGAGAVPVDVARARLRRLRGRRPEVAVRRPTAPGCSTSRPGSASACARSPPASSTSRTATRASTPTLHADARRYDTASLSREAAAFSLAATRVLDGAGLDAVHARAAGLAAGLADALAERGRTVAPRGATTLVTWEDPTRPRRAQRLADAGVIVRDLPGTPYLRASVGAWNDESDLERLLSAAAP